MQTTWLSNVEPSRFDEFLSIYWGAMREGTNSLPTEPPEGVGELSLRPWGLGYALDRTARFAAFRWDQLDGDSENQRFRRCELFFISPANSQPRACLRVQASHREDLPRVPPTWWSESLSLPTVPYHSTNLPGFQELAAILASNGNVTTSSADVQSELANMTVELDYLRQLSSELGDELRLSQAKVRDLLARPVPKSTPADDEPEKHEGEPITDLSLLPAWAERNSETIAVLPRALAGAKKSMYENPSMVFKALEFLAGPYREYRLGRIDKAAFDAEIAGTGFKLEGAIKPSVAGSQGDDYFITWNGRRRCLDMHIMKGGGRDERYCLRIYFFWDDDTAMNVVGWLPSHLNNSLS